MHLVDALALQDTDEDYAAEGLRVAQTYLHLLGITAYRTRSWASTSYRTLDTYVQAAGRGELTARVVGARGGTRTRGLDRSNDWSNAPARAAAGGSRRPV